MKLSCVALAAAAGLTFAQAAIAQDHPSLSAGRRIAAAQCGRCHAIDLQGDSLNPRAPRFRDLAARYQLDNLREALKAGMIVGHPALMPKIDLGATQIDDLIGYMKSLQPRSAQTPSSRARLRPAG